MNINPFPTFEILLQKKIKQSEFTKHFNRSSATAAKRKKTNKRHKKRGLSIDKPLFFVYYFLDRHIPNLSRKFFHNNIHCLFQHIFFSVFSFNNDFTSIFIHFKSDIFNQVNHLLLVFKFERS